MCTFHDDRTVMVCDSIRDRMRAGLGAEFGDRVGFTHVDYQGTLVEAQDGVETERFRISVQRLIDEQAAEEARSQAETAT